MPHRHFLGRYGNEPNPAIPGELEGDRLAADGRAAARARHQHADRDGGAGVRVVRLVEGEDDLIARTLGRNARGERHGQQGAGEKTNGPMASHARGSLRLSVCPPTPALPGWFRAGAAEPPPPPPHA